jgi:hypothetical protein
MSKLLSLKVNLDKIDKSKLYKGSKGTYLDLDVWINDEPDNYGNDASASLNLSKEERESGAKKVYVGNGKKLFGWGSDTGSESNVDIGSSAEPF